MSFNNIHTMLNRCESISEGIRYLLFTPPPPSKQPTSEDIINAFKSNYYRQKINSAISPPCIWATHAISYLVVKQAITSPLTFGLTTLGFVVSAIASQALWNMYGDQFQLLSERACQAMYEGHEDKALTCIRRGANIYQALPVSLYRKGFFGIGEAPFNLLTVAVQTDCRRVIDLLIILNLHDENTLTKALSFAKSVETIQLLIHEGAQVLGDGTEGHSPLYWQLKQFLYLHDNPNKFTREICQTKLRVVQYLINNAAALLNEKDVTDTTIATIEFEKRAQFYKEVSTGLDTVAQALTKRVVTRSQTNKVTNFPSMLRSLLT